MAVAAPKGNPRAKHAEAVKLDENGDPDGALAAIEEGLAVAPKDLPLLQLKGHILLRLREYSGALVAYQAYLDAGAAGANRREAQKIVRDLSAVRSTFLEVAASGPATIFLDTRTLGVFCSAAPSCTKPVLPGDYKVIAERPGFERWTGPVTVENGKTAKLQIALVEKASQLTVRVTPADARVRVDDQDYEGPMTVAAGPHPVVVGMRGYVEQRLDAAAHEGRPVDLEVVLVPLVAVRVEPSSATLRLDDGPPIALQDGGAVIPPGKHVLIGRAPGFRDQRVEIPAERPADYPVEVVLERIPPPPPPIPEPPMPLMRKLAIASAGFSAAAIVGGAVLLRESRQYERFARAYRSGPCTDGVEPCLNAENADAAQRGADRRAIGAYAAFAAAGAGAIAAALLWVKGSPESRVVVAPRVGPVAGLDLAIDLAIRF